MGDRDEGVQTHDVPWFVNLLRVRTGFPREVFDLVVLPVLERVGESSSSGAMAEQLVLQRLAVAARALELRRGLVLPRGMPPELVGGLAHRWTWAVVMAALAEAASAEEGTELLDGPMSTSLERMAPPEAIAWLLEDPDVTAALRAFLSDGGDRGGPLVSIIRRAEQDLFGADAVSAPTECASTDAGDVATVAAPTPGLAESPIARAFLDWIRDAVRRGTIEVNTPRAVVCRLAEGTLLVVPGVFREYARCVAMGECPCPRELSSSGRDIARSVRRQVVRAGWHVSLKDGVELVDVRLAGGETVRGLLLRSSVAVLGDDVAVAGCVLSDSVLAEA